MLCLQLNRRGLLSQRNYYLPLSSKLQPSLSSSLHPSSTATTMLSLRSPQPCVRLGQSFVQLPFRHSLSTQTVAHPRVAHVAAVNDGPNRSTTESTPIPAAPPARTTRGPAAVNDSIPEELFYEGSASNAELIISLLLGFTLVYIPITIAVIGKKLWFKYTFTNKRVKITNSSPLFAKTVEVAYKNITEVRTAPRAFGLWGDCVIFLKDGSRLEITGLERHQDIKRHILSCIYD